MHQHDAAPPTQFALDLRVTTHDEARQHRTRQERVVEAESKDSLLWEVEIGLLDLEQIRHQNLSRCYFVTKLELLHKVYEVRVRFGGIVEVFGLRLRQEIPEGLQFEYAEL